MTYTIPQTAEQLGKSVSWVGDPESNAEFVVLAVNAYERDQRIIKALSEALDALLEDDVVTRNIARADLIAARAALAMAKEVQGV